MASALQDIGCRAAVFFRTARRMPDDPQEAAMPEKKTCELAARAKAASRSAAAKKAARTKGQSGRSAAARKGARTRARRSR
ncbi:hypothetical protein ACFO6Q_13080 [Dokdonella ginsengisoli]|uniref:Uncharacterized protein n=1 Tax=Dokdonella ginsengisoli TaxID=363846 RepID=A0ABV9QXA6_9GAMM